MCMYCNMGDHTFRYDPPFEPDRQRYPSIPMPVYPTINPWELDRLREYHDLLKAVKEMEDKLGCPCEPNKADYLTVLKERIDEMQKKLDAAKREGA